jgi:Outer membrane protein beta-barrel domain
MNRMVMMVVATSLLLASPAIAKEGFYLGAFVPTDSISGDAGSNIDSGTGWGLRAGYGLNRYLALEANYSATSHDFTGGTTDLRGAAGDVKLSFPLTSLDSAEVMTVEPYALAGYGHYEFTKPSTVKSDGFQWGFGVELYLFRELSISAGWTRTSVSFDSTPKRDGAVKTVDFGVIYHFI